MRLPPRSRYKTIPEVWPSHHWAVTFTSQIELPTQFPSSTVFLTPWWIRCRELLYSPKRWQLPPFKAARDVVEGKAKAKPVMRTDTYNPLSFDSIVRSVWACRDTRVNFATVNPLSQKVRAIGKST